MRLRYLNLRDAPPLQQLAIPFWQESVLGRQCAIRFIVGINGSGKTRLLQALAQIFLALEGAPNTQLPFYFTLVYDLGREEHTIFVQYQPEDKNDSSPELRLIEYDWLNDAQTWDWENLPEQMEQGAFNIKKRIFKRSSGSVNSFLPQALLAYTSGVIETWETIFASSQTPVEIPAIGDVDERPINWDVERERRFLYEQGLTDAATNLAQVDVESLVTDSEPSRLGYFVSPKQLRLAVCAVTLQQASQDFRQMATSEAEAILLARWDDRDELTHSQSGLRHLLNEIGWRYPVTFGLRLHFEPDTWLDIDTIRIHQLYEVATAVIGEPEPGNERLLLFDLREPVTIGDETLLTIDALLNVFQEAESEEVTSLRYIYATVSLATERRHL